MADKLSVFKPIIFTIARNGVSYLAGYLTAHGILKAGQFTEAQSVEITIAALAFGGALWRAIVDKISSHWWLKAALKLPEHSTPAQIQVEATDLQKKDKGNP